ncbi:MAG: cbb3-type cytochrome oxidase assembly protein CcoS [Pseudomonadales bacterium]|nr:cbb3-type cytochrome oxidase assembly protein CcoS [Pseudomonadales bacterium]
MELFLVLIPVTVALVALSLWAFVWSARHEQFDDLDRQAYSILFDEDENKAPEPETLNDAAAQGAARSTGQEAHRG